MKIVGYSPDHRFMDYDTRRRSARRVLTGAVCLSAVKQRGIGQRKSKVSSDDLRRLLDIPVELWKERTDRMTLTDVTDRNRPMWQVINFRSDNMVRLHEFVKLLVKFMERYRIAHPSPMVVWEVYEGVWTDNLCEEYNLTRADLTFPNRNTFPGVVRLF